MALPRHLLAAMAKHPEVEQVHLAVSKGAVQVLKHEAGAEGNVVDALIAGANLEEDEHNNPMAKKIDIRI